MPLWCLLRTCLVLLAAQAFAACAAAAPSADDPDAPFYQVSAQAGLAEIAGGLLAQQKGRHPEVVAFGAMMVKDYQAANQRLRALATVNQVDLPLMPTAEQTAKQAQLGALAGDDFDRAYIEWQILAHKDAIELFRREGESGDDTEARQFALDTLPTLRARLAALYALPMIAPAPPAAATTPDSAVR